MNTPLAMVLTGVFLSDVKLRELVGNLRVYRAAALRLLLFPALLIVLLRLFGFPSWFQGSEQVYLAIAVVAACPTAAFSILFSARMKLDGAHSAKLVAVSTILSIFTLPLMIYFAQMIQ
jgi:predicted permease